MESFTESKVARFEDGEVHVNGDGASENMDAAYMAKVGLKQETKRRFGLVTILGFTACMMCTWECALPFFMTAFINGGPVSMIYGYIFAFIGALATCASLAELASMYPISGGQYYWVSILAPPGKTKFLSFWTGWISVFGWQAASALGTYLGGTIIQAVVALNYPNYKPERWQATLMLYAVLALTLFVNMFLVKWLPGLEGLMFMLHIVGFFAIMIPVVHLAEISPVDFVFTSWSNMSGYPSDGLSWLIGQAGSAILFIGYDGACHMAEEVINAPKNVPRAMFFTIFINGAMGFAMYLVILFCFGDPEKTLEGPTGYPFIEIFSQATQSRTAATVMTCVMITMYICATFNFMASASRQAWAFARDGGLPFSHVFRRVQTKQSIPLYAIALTGVINLLLGLINFGSSVAFSAVTSLVVSSYMTSYVIAIMVMVHKRFTDPNIHFGPWNLGRFGLAVNIFAILYTLVTVVFTFFPPMIPVNKETMNYSPVVYGGVSIFGMVYYFFLGHKTFVGPRLPENLRS